MEEELNTAAMSRPLIILRAAIIDGLAIAGLAMAGLIVIYGNRYIPGSPLAGWIAMPALFSVLCRNRK